MQVLKSHVFLGANWLTETMYRSSWSFPRHILPFWYFIQQILSLWIIPSMAYYHSMCKCNLIFMNAIIFDNCLTDLNELSETQLRALLDEGKVNKEGKWLPWPQCLFHGGFLVVDMSAPCIVSSVSAANYVTCWTKTHQRWFSEAWAVLVSCSLQNAEILVIVASYQMQRLRCAQKRTILASSNTLQNIAGGRVNIVSESPDYN